MFNEEMFKSMLTLFTNPVYQKSFLDYYMKMQQEGMNKEFFDKMTDF